MEIKCPVCKQEMELHGQFYVHKGLKQFKCPVTSVTRKTFDDPTPTPPDPDPEN